MKIEVKYLNRPNTIEEISIQDFADRFGIVMKVRELRVVSPNDPKFEAKFEELTELNKLPKILNANTLYPTTIPIVGMGSTVEQAIANYAAVASNRELVHGFKLIGVFNFKPYVPEES